MYNGIQNIKKLRIGTIVIQITKVIKNIIIFKKL